MKFSTRAIHGNDSPEKSSGAVVPPIFLTTTYAQKAPGEHQGYEYTRADNPTFTMAEKLIASLEGANYATVFSSGLGALTALVSTLKKGDSIIAIEGLYGGTYRLFTAIFEKFGLSFTLVGKEELHLLDSFLKQKPKFLLVESPSNPLLDIYDLEELTKKAKKAGVKTIVDNTFATPYFQNPLDWGADIVWHSCTKYLGGHSDIIGGAMVTNDIALKEAFNFQRMAIGVNPSPFDVWLLARSIKTLPLRMQQHESNALKVATFLEAHPLIKTVYYPGLKSHPNHLLAKKQMRGFGGVVSAELNVSVEEVKKIISSFRYFTLAESLGCVESLINHPATMTHASIPREVRIKSGLSDTLVRFSVGTEDSEDLIEDLKETLERK